LASLGEIAPQQVVEDNPSQDASPAAKTGTKRGLHSYHSGSFDGELSVCSGINRNSSDAGAA